jgi:hypothetical protein
MEARDWLIVAVVVVAAIALAYVAWQALQRRRVRQRFGPEFDRTVDITGRPRAAERDLRSRQQARDELDVRPLEPAARQRYADAWQQTQAQFVDAPVEIIRSADDLLVQVMRERGYPVDDYDRQTGAISVDHPGVVGNYRVAHEIAVRSKDTQVTAEDLRRAMLHFRSLFDELLGESAHVDGSARR